MSYAIPQVAKAIAAALTAGAAALTAALLDGHIDGGELVTIIAAVIGAGGVVFGVKNAANNNSGGL